MGMIEDFTNSIVNTLTNFMKDSVESALTCAANLLSDGLTSTTTTSSPGHTGIISAFLYASPFEWKAGAEDEVDGVSIWHTLGTICNSAVVPLGAFVLSVILIYELVSLVDQSNSFRQMDSSIFVRWTLKFICGVLFVSNIFKIVQFMFALGTSFTKKAGDNYISITNLASDGITVPSGLSFGDYLILLLLSGVLIIAIMILICVIIVVLCSRMLECFMYIGIAPVTSATFWSQDWKDIGFNWFKNILALALQGLFIIFAIGIFGALMTNVLKTLASGGDSVYMQMAILLGYTVAMIFTMLRTGSISKSIFNAH